MVQKTLEEAIKEYLNLGFDKSIITLAWNNVKGDDTKILDEIFELNSKNKSMEAAVSKPVDAMDEEEIIGKAIQESLDLAKEKKISFEPLNPEQRLRKSGVPVGLKNIGNTCYFNSLLQTYFSNINFVRQVLAFVEPEFSKNVKDADKGKDPQIKRKIASINLVKHLQILFAGMIASDKKYLDPTLVVTSVVDDYGNQLPVGDQKDIAEFNLFFLARVQEGISLQDRYSGKRMVEESNNDDSPSKIGFIKDHGEEHHLLKRSSVRMMEQSNIGRQFLGKNQTTFINEKEGIRKSEDQIFSLLYANVRFHQLYTAFEEVIVSTIDDYKNQKGETVTVEKQCWIKEAPRTLFFQIERVVYDKEKLALKKIHDQFEFPKQFHIDPFLKKNEVVSLKIRSEANKLRKQKTQVEDGLKKIENYENSHVGVDQLLTLTLNLLQKQSSGMQIENDPTVFSQLKAQIAPQTLHLLTQMKAQTQLRLHTFKEKKSHLEKLIDQSYKGIMTTEPYILQSIMIHEGQAESGHYYSYTYDTDRKIWRKFNDINVSEEAEQQVLKEAKGLNYASAYCLVYAKADHHPESKPLRSYKLSTEAGYGEDLYSTFMTPEIKSLITTENQVLYHDIHNFKAVGFVNKVIDHYVKRFESLNELFRKLKIPEKLAEKKKNMVPTLVNLPLYIKTVSTSAEEYKAAVIESAVISHGPKEQIPVFQEVLKNKLTNLSDFKKPQYLTPRKTFVDEFVQNCRQAVAAKYVYDCIGQNKWIEALAALNWLRMESIKPESSVDYFSWLSALLSKIVVFQLMIEAEKAISQGNFDEGLTYLRLTSYLYNQISGLIEEGGIRTNLVYWIAQLAIAMPEIMKPELSAIAQSINLKKQIPEYNALVPDAPKELFDKFASMDMNDLMWNFSRHEDTLAGDMASAQEKVKGKMAISNNLLKEIKKVNIPLSKQGRDKIIKAI